MRISKPIPYFQLILLHIVIGILVNFSKVSSKFIFLGVFIFLLIWVIASGNKKDQVLFAAAYITGFEVFSRMTGGLFFYEFAKYAVVFFLLLGMFYRGFEKRSWPYAMYLVLLIPAILFSAMNLDYETDVFKAIRFNLSGPVAIGIAALYCYNRKMPQERLNSILVAVLLPLISMAIYLFLYTPNIRDVITGTQSNFETSGGFGPNQVSTVMGLAMFILFTRLFLIRNRVMNMIDLALLTMVSYRAIVTFSRGGVITAGACAFIFIVFFFFRTDAITKAKLFPKIAIITLAIAFTWIYTSVNTSGLIDKRYANQNAAGVSKDDLSTGRLELLDSELQAFYQNPITGIGIGKVKEFREKEYGRLSASHNEMSRLLSEHGISGLFGMIILLLAPLIFRIRNKSNLFLHACLAFWFLTINHSSMRIVAPAFIYGLSLITITKNDKKNSLHRK